MLTSSTKNTIFLFTGAPKRVLRFFSSLLSIRYCVSMACVCAEKLMVKGTMERGPRIFSSASTVMTDLPTPVTPVKSTERRTSRHRSSRNEYRTVSTVGTRIWKYGSALLYVKAGTLDTQGLRSGGNFSAKST